MKNKSIIKIFLFISIILLSFSINAQTINWNVPIGGNIGRSGLSQNLGPLVEPGGEPELFWSGGEYAKFAGHPVIEGDKLITYRRWASASQTEAWIVCYNVYDGTELWKITLPVDPQSDHYSKVSGVNNGQVYANRAGGESSPSWLYALDIETGDVLWQSEDKVTEQRTETVTFRENGDLIAGNWDKILCISKDDGSTLWELDRNSTSSDGNSVSIYGNKGYYWDKNGLDLLVSVCDLQTGEYLYSSDVITNGSIQIQQSGLMVGPGGTVYAPRSSNSATDSLVSLTDQGNSLTENWRYAIAWVTVGNHGVGPDGTVYTYSRDEEVVRLDPLTGEVINNSIQVTDDDLDGLAPSIAIGDDGMVYLAVEDYPFFKLYIFTPELELLWGEEINGLRGVALGDSVLAINAKGTIIRTYKGRPNPISGLDETNTKENIVVYPNPSNGVFNIYGNFNHKNKEAMVDIITVSGEVIYSTKISTGCNTPLKVNISGQKEGIYFVRYFVNDQFYFQKIINQ